MKKLLALLVTVFLVAMALSSNAQIKKVEVQDNYLIMTDTTTEVIDFEYPKADVRYSSTGFESVAFFGRSDTRIGDQMSYKLDSLVDASSQVFVNYDSLRAFLRRSTGIKYP